MYVRGLQEAEARLLELHHAEKERVIVGATALGASLGATIVFPPLAVPLFVGGMAIGALGVSAIWRHWDLVDRLADDRDAYRISEVRAYGAREATMDRRRRRAALIRGWTSCPDARIGEFADELTELADALEDEDLELEPASAIACRRFVSEPSTSPLLDGVSAPEDIRSAIARIRSGFSPRTSA